MISNLRKLKFYFHVSNWLTSIILGPFFFSEFNLKHPIMHLVLIIVKHRMRKSNAGPLLMYQLPEKKELKLVL